MPEDDDFVRITLRIPKKVHEQLTDAAAKKRSMNAEIIHRLEASFTTPIVMLEELPGKTRPMTETDFQRIMRGVVEELQGSHKRRTVRERAKRDNRD